MAKTQYTIIRTDLFPNLKSLEAVLEDYKLKGLEVEQEVQKLIDLGYIKESK